MFFRRKNAKPRPRFTKRKWSKKSTRKGAGVPAPIKSYVNRLIRRNEETKFSSNQYTLTNFNSGIGVSADMITVLPQVLAGTGQNNRIGTKIRPVRMEITGYVVYQATQVAANSDAKMIGARLFLFQDRTTNSYTNNIYNYQLLDAGGTPLDFTGIPMNWVTPHNNSQFKFFADKKFKLLKPYGLTNHNTSSSTVSITGMDSSLFHPFKIVLTQKQLPAVLHYDETDSLAYPTNFAPYMALGYCDLLNASPDTVGQQIAMEFNCTLYYKDA